MSASQLQVWAVIIADVVGSSEVPELRRIRDRTLAGLSRQHLVKHRVLAHYTVTAWNEFQNVLTHPWEVPQVVWDLRLAFFPIELRIGLGIGAIDDVPGPSTAINEASSGECFFRAREAISSMNREAGKYPLRTSMRSGDPNLDRTTNLIYMLADSLMSGLTERQKETIRAYDATGSQEMAAERLQVSSESTVSRNLQRGYYWQLQDCRLELSELLRTYFA